MILVHLFKHLIGGFVRGLVCIVNSMYSTAFPVGVESSSFVVGNF